MKTVLIYLSYARNGVHMGEIVLGVFGLYLIFQTVMGYRRGFLKSMLNLASWILTFAIAYEGAGYFKDIVIENVPQIQGTIITDQIAYVISYMILVIICKILFSIVARFINKISKIPGVGFLNRMAGALLGLAKGSLVIMFLIFFISLMPHLGMQTEYEQIIGGSEIMQTMVDTNPLGEMIQQQIKSETQKLLRN